MATIYIKAVCDLPSQTKETERQVTKEITMEIYSKLLVAMGNNSNQ